MEDLFLKRDELAKRWKVHIRTIDNISPNLLPRTRIGFGKKAPSVRFRLSDVIKYELSNLKKN